jgi:hypothetical protein
VKVETYTFERRSSGCGFSRFVDFDLTLRSLTDFVDLCSSFTDDRTYELKKALNGEWILWKWKREN